LGRLGFNFATAVFEANRIDPLLILIGLKQSEPDPEQYSQHHQKKSPSATVAKICATDRSIQRFCADHPFGDLGQGCLLSL